MNVIISVEWGVRFQAEVSEPQIEAEVLFSFQARCFCLGAQEHRFKSGALTLIPIFANKGRKCKRHVNTSHQAPAKQSATIAELARIARKTNIQSKIPCLIFWVISSPSTMGVE